MPRYYPVNLVLENKKCVVIGAGRVAQRKVARLLECGARVTVIAPDVTAGLKALSEKKRIAYKKRQAGLKDLKGAYIVIVATTDRRLNSQISAYCHKNNILVNVVDYPKECSFIVPSIVRRGNLTISISTDGISCALARNLRMKLEREFGEEYASYLEIMKTIRPRVQSQVKNPQARKMFFQKAIRSDVMKLLKRGKREQAKKALERILENAKS